jgi:hypothetical protein
MLTLAAAHLLQRRLVPKRVLARLYDEGEAGRDGLARFSGLGFLAGGHRAGRGREVVVGGNRATSERLEFAAVKHPAAAEGKDPGIGRRATRIEIST